MFDAILTTVGLVTTSLMATFLLIEVLECVVAWKVRRERAKK